MVVGTISSRHALVADGMALRRLLGEVPDAADIKTEFDKPYFSWRWQHIPSRRFWLTSDGTTVVCLTLSGLGLEETIAPWICFDVHRWRSGLSLSAEILSEVIRAEIGLIVEIES